MDEIFNEIKAERERQDAKWGGAKHDDLHGPHDWMALLVKHAGSAAFTTTAAAFRGAMIRVAAIAVAAVQFADRQIARSKQDKTDDL